MIILLTLGKLKLDLTEKLEQLSGLLVHAAGTPPCLLRPVKVSTSSELYPDYFQLPTFLDCSGTQFFDSPLFPNTVS